jgi:hypothetical protein
MRTTDKPVSWVVYQMTTRGKTVGVKAVCEQGEWDAMERAQPGYHTLIQAGIANEGEAERLARAGTPGAGGDKKARTALGQNLSAASQ